MKRIFSYQTRGNIAEAVRSASRLEDSLLLGTALADRFLSRYYRSGAGELTDWLQRYADQPEAAAIHDLLLTRLPRGVSPPPPPESHAIAWNAGPVTLPVPEDIDPPRNDLVRNPVLDRTVLERSRRGGSASALRLIAATRGLSPAYAAQLRAEVAQILFIRNEDADALVVAQQALDTAGGPDKPGLAFYIGGLAAWRLDRIGLARSLFEDGAQATGTSPRLHAASAFWASRANRALHDAGGTVKWLLAAAEERLTFHGLLARRILRMDTGILDSGEVIGQADVDAVAASPRGLRAFALLQIGQTGRAEAEFRGLWATAGADAVFQRSILLVVSAAGLSDCEASMAALLQSRDGGHHDELRFPMPRLRPAGGFSIDPPLVYALARQESNFDTGALSPSGARGLMQIMPSTARYIAGDSMSEPDRLNEPASNLEIGQRYVAYLARQDGIDNDLLRILASYNAGPGHFGQWGAGMQDRDDPLLFIEAIPVPETRAFVEHVLVYSWIYAARLRLPASSLEALAAGEFPRFTQRPAERKMTVTAAGIH